MKRDVLDLGDVNSSILGKDDGVSFHLVSNHCSKHSPPLPSLLFPPLPCIAERTTTPCDWWLSYACVSVFLLALSLQPVLLISIQNKRTSSADLVPFLFLLEPIFVIYTVLFHRKSDEPYRIRTCDPLIKSQMLYRLS